MGTVTWVGLVSSQSGPDLCTEIVLDIVGSSG